MEQEDVAKKFLEALQVSENFIQDKNPSEAITELFVSCFRSDPNRLLRNFVLCCKSEQFEDLKVMVNKFHAQHFIRHVIGELTDNIQRCVICGEVVNDYRGAMWPAGQEAPTGFPKGDIYVSAQGNPKMFCSDISEYDTYINCKDENSGQV